MTLAQIFIERLQHATGKKPLPKKFVWDYSRDAITPTFQGFLDKFADYCESLPTKEQKDEASKIFWDQVKTIGTPIIESISEDKVRVHFLFPQDNYDSRNKKLYVAGDYHGFTSTNEARQAMNELVGTNIMHRSDDMPKDSVVTYNYIQIDPKYADKNRPFFSGPSEALPPSFYSKAPQEEFKPFETDPFENSALTDMYSKHPEPSCCPPGMAMFCANIDNDLSSLGLTEIDWPTLLNTDKKNSESLKSLTHKGTYLCAKNDDLKEEKPIGDDYLKVLDDHENTRAISVFEPRSGVVDNVIIVNDGIGYMTTNTVERLNKLIQENQIPENTAVVFVTALPGLIDKYREIDPKKYSSVNDERAIEYGHEIENYAKYLDEKLLLQLGYNKVPASNRTLIGSSMSGTASLYMGFEHKDKFGKVIAQAPSYSNRFILNNAIAKRIDDKTLGKAEDLTDRVQLSNGEFDSLEHAQNLNLAHTKELAKVLGHSNQSLPIHTGKYGHLIHGWSRELVTTLPRLYRKERELIHQNAELEAKLKQANVPGVSIATISSAGVVASRTAGVSNIETHKAVTDTTLFQAASLSKSVFAYIVLKMVERGMFSRPGETPESGLDRPLHEICDFGPPHLRAPPNDTHYKSLTIRNLLSHQAGLPNWFESGKTEAYIATAETRFDYSGVAYCFLNDVVEHVAGKKPLEVLSREVFDEEPLKMSHSSFVPPPEGSSEHTNRAIGHNAEGAADKRAPSLPIRANPAASLVTTAEDYAKFLNACLHDEFIRTHMFEPQLGLAGKDQKAMDARVPEETLQQMSWGIGMGLQTASNGDTIAFHWGDNETSRALIAINLRTNEAAVCLTNSANGPALFRDVIEPAVGNIDAVSEWLSKRERLPIQESVRAAFPNTVAENHDVQQGAENPSIIYRKRLESMRSPGYLAPTAASEAKEREKYEPPPPIKPWR